MAKKEIKKEEVQKEEVLTYKITFPDGTVSEGTTSLRPFNPNTGKGFQNSGFQAKISSGNFSGSLMIIDYSKQKLI
jgi:hypothetical protein